MTTRYPGDDSHDQVPLFGDEEASPQAALPNDAGSSEKAPNTKKTSHEANMQSHQSRARTLIIESVLRVPEQGEPEQLFFGPGVNLLVGPPNAGKSRWLRFIDFVLADGEPPEATLSPELAEKYRSARVVLRICETSSTVSVAADEKLANFPTRHGDGEADALVVAASEGPVGIRAKSDDSAGDANDLGGRVLTLERRWKEPGMKGKVFVDGDPMTAEDCGAYLLSLLGIPVVHYPKGDPYAPRAWPILGWRTLFRHVYREERFWSDLADKQPEGDQHAVLVQFLGLAESLFSTEYGSLIAKRKAVQQLRVRRESYMLMLHQVTNELGRFSEFSVAITPASLADARARLETERGAVSEHRLAILRELAETVVISRKEDRVQTRTTFEERSTALAQARANQQLLRDELARTDARMAELHEHRASVRHERERLERAQVAGQALAELRVTHCPVCDQSVRQARGGASDCFLCLQPHDIDDNGASLGSRRIAFETEQLQVEDEELGEVIARHDANRRKEAEKLVEIEEQIGEIEALLRPTHAAAAAVLPPDLSLLDQVAGRVDEQLRTLDSVAKSLGQRDALSAEIDRIESEASRLEAEVEAQSKEVGYEAASMALAEGFDTYFNNLNRGETERWPEGPVGVRIRKRDYLIMVKNAEWKTKLGATLACFFLNGYHYALLSLSGRPGFHYPGLAIIDFPPTLADGHELTDEENYLIEPFIPLVEHRLPVRTQLIVAGRAFVGLAGANRIALTTVYK